MSCNRPVVVGLGELLWDSLLNGEVPGGAPANFAFHATQLGANGIVVSAVGKDSAGVRLCAWMSASGVDPSYVQSVDQATGRVSVSLSPSGQPTYLIHEDVAWDQLVWNDRLQELAASASCVCVGSLAERSPRSRETIHRFLHATSPGCLRIFDVNLRQPHVKPTVIAETIALSNVVKLNDEEWPSVAEYLSLNINWKFGLPQMMERYSLRLVALTFGAYGSVLIDKDGVHECLGPQVEVADTIGAGDAFTAAVALGLLRGFSISQIHRRAAAVAGFVCTQRGATPLLPDALRQENDWM